MFASCVIESQPGIIASRLARTETAQGEIPGSRDYSTDSNDRFEHHPLDG